MIHLEIVILSAASRGFLREAESKDLRLAYSVIVLCSVSNLIAFHSWRLYMSIQP